MFGGKASATQQNTSQQEKPSGNERQEPAQAQSKGTTTPKTLKILYPKCYFEANNGVLLFIIINENYKVLEAKCKNEDQEGKVIPEEFLVFVKCIDENFCITGSYDSQQDVSNGKKSVSITSIKKKNTKNLVSSNPSEMMYQVGLDENRKFVEISRMSRKPFKAPTLEQPNPNVTSHNATQQVVNNEGVPTESEEFFDAEDDGVTQPKSLTTDMVVEQADIPNQPTPSAVPNKSQDNSIVIPEGAKLKFFPEISGFLSRASLERERLFCKVAPNSLLVHTREEPAAGNNRSC